MEENKQPMPVAKIEKVNTEDIKLLQEKEKLLNLIDSLRNDKSFKSMCEKYKKK